MASEEVYNSQSTVVDVTVPSGACSSDSDTDTVSIGSDVGSASGSDATAELPPAAPKKEPSCGSRGVAVAVDVAVDVDDDDDFAPDPVRRKPRPEPGRGGGSTKRKSRTKPASASGAGNTPRAGASARARASGKRRRVLPPSMVDAKSGEAGGDVFGFVPASFKYVSQVGPGGLDGFGYGGNGGNGGNGEHGGYGSGTAPEAPSDAPPKEPVVYFCSRTHSQISQVVFARVVVDCACGSCVRMCAAVCRVLWCFNTHV